MFCPLLLLLVMATDARLRGFQAEEVSSQDVPPARDCGEQAAAEAAEDADFDEVALLQREVAPAQGMHEKSTDEWLAHYNDHDSKIGADQRKLDNATVSAQLFKIEHGACADDPLWRDADGDGCEIYRFAIKTGKTTQEAACTGGGEIPAAPGLRGARMIVADATAKVFCPVTCGMCEPAGKPEHKAESLLQLNESFEHAEEGLDEVNFLQIGVSAAAGPAKKSTEFWEEHLTDGHTSRITADQRVLHNETVSYRLQQLEKGEGCADDPLWQDADGDGCEIYRFAIESGKTSREMACGGGGEQALPQLRGARQQVVADATAKVFCPVTCGVC